MDLRYRDVGFIRLSDKFLGDQYRRAVSYGYQMIKLAIYNREGAVELDSPYAGVRLDAVEDLVSRFEDPSPVPLRPIDYQARSTIGFRVEPKGFIGVFRKSWIISTESAAVAAAEEFVPEVISKASPFWERFSGQRNILSTLTADDEESRLLGGPDHFRAKRAFALTLLLDGKDAAQKVAQAKLSVLQGDQLAEFRGWLERALA